MEAGSEPLTAARSADRPAASSGALLRALPYLLAGAAALAFMLSLPLAIGRADESHLLAEARRVAMGQALYRDFFESLTPLSFYLFAAVFALGGTTLFAARAVIGVVLAAAAALLWHLVRRVSGALEAALMVPLFIFVAVPTWPYASPHWLSTMFALATAAVTLNTSRTSWARAQPFLAGVLGGAAVCTQQQRGAFLALWLPLALLLLADGPPPRWRRTAATLAWAAAGGALVVGGILGYSAWLASPAVLVEMLIGFAVSHYGPTHSGNNAWAVVLPFTQRHASATWWWLMRIAPLFIVAEAAGLVLQRRRPWPRRERERAALCLLAALMAASVWYLPDVIHVAFVLPFMLIPAASALHRLRHALPAGAARPARIAAAVLVIACTAAAIRNGVSARGIWQASAPARIQTAYGELAVDPIVPPLFATLQEHLVREPDGRAVFYSYPNEAWLYLALPAENPTPFSILIPEMFPDAYFEQVAAVLRARTPGTVLIMKLLLDKPQAQMVQQAVDAGYDLAAELELFRVYRRRGGA